MLVYYLIYSFNSFAICLHICYFDSNIRIEGKEIDKGHDIHQSAGGEGEGRGGQIKEKDSDGQWGAQQEV